MDSEFVEFCISQGALSFGEFRLKSGRISPYFFNAGVFCTGHAIERLGFYFARKISATLKPQQYDLVFGPAYKGIPLAVAASISLSRDFGIDKPWCFNRKEAKEHGDKGVFVGTEPKDGSRIVLIDDVFTTGGAKEEAIAQLSSAAKISIAGVFIALDRKEKNEEGQDSIAAFEKKHKTGVHSIVSAPQVFDYLLERKVNGHVLVGKELYGKFGEYFAKHGV